MIRNVGFGLCTIAIFAAAVQAAEPAELQELREQRVVVAKQRLHYAEERYAGGTLAIEHVLAAQSQLAEANYEAASTMEGRIAARAEAVTIAEGLWDLAQRRSAGGAGSQLDSAQAEYALLTARLRLAEEKQKSAATEQPQKADGEGFEGDSLTSCPANMLRQIENRGEAESEAVLLDSGLQAVLAAWPSLPEAIKAGILAMIGTIDRK